MYFEKRTARNRKYRKFLHSHQQKLILLGVFVFVISIVCGCSNQKEQESDGSLQKITVGIDKFEPYSYLDMDGNYTGVDIEIASKVFHELGYEPDFKFITWSEKHTCLADGTIDCIWSCYSMNDRENDYQWAGPYLYSRQVIAVAAASAFLSSLSCSSSFSFSFVISRFASNTALIFPSLSKRCGTITERSHMPFSIWLV